MDALALSSLVLVMFVLQAFFDLVFVFLCYLTGMIALKLATVISGDLEILNYGGFKKNYKTESSYKKPIVVGFIIWLAAITLALVF